MQPKAACLLGYRQNRISPGQKVSSEIASRMVSCHAPRRTSTSAFNLHVSTSFALTLSSGRKKRRACSSGSFEASVMCSTPSGSLSW